MTCRVIIILTKQPSQRLSTTYQVPITTCRVNIILTNQASTLSSTTYQVPITICRVIIIRTKQPSQLSLMIYQVLIMICQVNIIRTKQPSQLLSTVYQVPIMTCQLFIIPISQASQLAWFKNKPQLQALPQPSRAQLDCEPRFAVKYKWQSFGKRYDSNDIWLFRPNQKFTTTTQQQATIRVLCYLN